MSRQTPVEKTIWWSIDDNVILFVKPVGERAYRYTFRSDIWLPGRAERRTFTGIVEKCFGVRLDEDRLLLFNRVPLGEYAVNVYGEGLRLGVLEYTGRGWKLHPTGALASILYTLGARSYRVDVGRRMLKGKKVVIEGAEGEYVIIETETHVGPAERISGSEYKVRDMAPKGFRLLEKPGDVKHLVERNAAYLRSLEAEAVGFAKRLDPGNNEPVYVAFSGGADSTATLLIAVEAFGEDRVVAVYVDTGIEFEATRRYAEKIASKLGVDLIIVEDDGVYWRLLSVEGVPTRDRRWCTARLKIEALKALLEKLKPRLILEGVRAFESQARLTIGDVSRSPVASTARRAFPVYTWSRLEVQLYLAWKGVEPNPLYDEGLVRIGCVVCPAMHLHELEVSKRLEPAKFEAIVERFSLLLAERSIVLSGAWRRVSQ